MTRRLTLAGIAVALILGAAARADPQPLPPRLTAPVNDFAHAIDAQSAQELDRIIRALQGTTLAELVEFSRCSDPEPASKPATIALPVVQAG